jgi:hypothetical protein
MRTFKALRGIGLAACLAIGLLAVAASAALALVTPGWECVPTTAGQAVVSGGTGETPSCTTGTPVLAPTYVGKTIGARPTVEFSAFNVQIASGAAKESVVNGEGNLVVGTDEAPGTQTGSNNLVLGDGQGYTGYGSLLFGSQNTATGNFDLVGGAYNKVTTLADSDLGGDGNTISSAYGAVIGGCDNRIAPSSLFNPPVSAFCSEQMARAGSVLDDRRRGGQPDAGRQLHRRGRRAQHRLKPLLERQRR